MCVCVCDYIKDVISRCDDFNYVSLKVSGCFIYIDSTGEDRLERELRAKEVCGRVRKKYVIGL